MEQEGWSVVHPAIHLLFLFGVGQVVCLGGIPDLAPPNFIQPNSLQELLDHRQHLFDPNLLGGKRSQDTIGDDRKFINDITVGLLLRELTKSSNFPTLVATNISEKCHYDSQDYFTANLCLVPWANQMFESMGKLPEGLFYGGNVHANGLFDECIGVQAEWTSTSFQGQYCTVFLEEALVMPWELENEPKDPNGNQMGRANWLTIFQSLAWLYDGPALKQPKVRDTDLSSKYLPSVDFCIPSSCSVDDFRSAIAQLIGSRVIGNTTKDGEFYYTSMVAVTDENYCYTKQKITASQNLDGPEIAVIVVLSLLGLAVVTATSREMWLVYRGQPVQTKKDSFSVKALHCFSMLTNSQKLISTKFLAVDSLSCLNGIRVLSTGWIVLFHTYYHASFNSMIDRTMFNEDVVKWQVHGILNGTLAVDTFLVMSGLLVAYSLLRELDRNKGRFNIGLFYIHRYLRLTPVYGVILGFIATLLIYLGAGPNWQNIRDLSTACRWNWWNNLLYVNNYVFTHPTECMGETWYLACDMQMYLLSPLFIYPLWKWWKAGLAWAIFNILALIGGTIAIFIVWDLPATLFFGRPEAITNPHFNHGYYTQMWTRFPPYILGILLGWVLHHTKNTKIKIKPYAVASGWTLAICILLIVTYGMVPYANPGEVPEIDNLVRVSYGSLHRLAWSISISWIIFACTHGYGGFVNRFLSWKIFIPFARLTFVVYLIHLNYIKVFHAFSRQPYFYIKFYHTEHYFGTILMVFLMAYAICLTIEVPFLNLEKLILPARSKKPAAVDIEQTDIKIPRIKTVP